MLPTFLGIGANRAGTTWAHRNLAEHPDIFIPWAKELHFFDRDERYDAGIQTYEDEFQEWAGQLAVGEITPRYLHYEPAAERIAKHLPDAKLFCFLRNPVERAYSQYWRSEAHSEAETPISFETKLETMPDIIRTGFYDEHLQRYQQYFPASQLHVCIFDDIKSRPTELLSDLYTFVGVDSGFVPTYAEHKINASASQGKLAKSNVIWKVRKVLKRMGGGVATLEKKLESMNATSLPPMTPETRERLQKLYRDHTLRLQEMIDRDLSAWLE